MHVLRHYFASALLEDGVSIKALAEYLGHADAGFTLRTYMMPASEDRMRKAVDRARCDGRRLLACPRCALGRWLRCVLPGQRLVRLDVEVELELVRMRAQPDRVDLVGALEVDPGLD